MHVKRKRGWEIPRAPATPEAICLNRRQILAASGIAASRRAALPGAWRRRADRPDRRSLSGAAQHEIHDRAAGHAGSDQHQLQQFLRIRHAEEHRAGREALPIRPWEVKIDGLVEKEFTIDIDDLIRKMPLEERLYRHRCVEALVDDGAVDRLPARRPGRARQAARRANYLRMETFMIPTWPPGRSSSGIRGPMSRG